MFTFERLLELFLDYLTAECGLSRHTVAAYRRDLSAFETFLTAKGIDDLDQVSSNAIVDFLMAQKRRGLASASCSRQLVAVRMFYRFCHAEKLTVTNPSSLIESPKIWQHRYWRGIKESLAIAPRRNNQDWGFWSAAIRPVSSSQNNG